MAPLLERRSTWPNWLRLSFPFVAAIHVKCLCGTKEKLIEAGFMVEFGPQTRLVGVNSRGDDVSVELRQRCDLLDCFFALHLQSWHTCMCNCTCNDGFGPTCLVPDVFLNFELRFQLQCWDRPNMAQLTCLFSNV